MSSGNTFPVTLALLNSAKLIGTERELLESKEHTVIVIGTVGRLLEHLFFYNTDMYDAAPIGSLSLSTLR